MRAQKVDTRVVYDRETGEVLHVHQSLAMPGVELPDEAELRAAALDMARESAGPSAERMEVISVREEDLRAGARYKVDVERRCLVASNAEST